MKRYFKSAVYEDEYGYFIQPENDVVYFFWAVWRNIVTLFAPFPYNLTRYYTTSKEARKHL